MNDKEMLKQMMRTFIAATNYRRAYAEYKKQYDIYVKLKEQSK